MNFLVLGNLGSGKDTFAECLPALYIHEAFANELKNVCRLIRLRDYVQAYNIMYRLFNYNPPKRMLETFKRYNESIPRTEEKDRKLLQEFGTNFARAYDQDVWVRGLQDKIKPGRFYVVTDCRFENEFNAFPDWVKVFVDTDLDVRKQRIILRDGRWDDAWTQHESELSIAALKGKCDFILPNNGTKEDFKGTIEAALKEYIGR